MNEERKELKMQRTLRKELLKINKLTDLWIGYHFSTDVLYDLEEMYVNFLARTNL